VQAERAGVDIITVEVGRQRGKVEGDGSLPGRMAIDTDETGLAKPADVLDLRQRVFEALSKHHTPPTMLQSKL